jgi:hypothetical protein
MNKRLLFIGGSLNQTTMMHQISTHFSDYACYFSPYYTDGFHDFLTQRGMLDFTVLGGRFRQQTEQYLKTQNLTIDYKGNSNYYHLVFTCQDLIIPANIRTKKIVLVQEGMTDPENFMFHLVKNLKLPLWLGSTSATGLSDAYQLFFVASEGYKQLFIKKGVNPDKIVVTGIPNFDNVSRFLNNSFPYKNFVLAATSDRRETFNFENRKEFIKKVVRIANGRQMIFKLHPNENWERATGEINKYAPGALVFTNENINDMIANCDVLITRYSSVVYIGMALGKEVHSDFEIDFLKKLTPIQNGGKSAELIASVTRKKLLTEKIHYSTQRIHATSKSVI